MLKAGLSVQSSSLQAATGRLVLISGKHRSSGQEGPGGWRQISGREERVRKHKGWTRKRSQAETMGAEPFSARYNEQHLFVLMTRCSPAAINARPWKMAPLHPGRLYRLLPGLHPVGVSVGGYPADFFPCVPPEWHPSASLFLVTVV